MNSTFKTNGGRPRTFVLLTASAVMIITLVMSIWICYRVMMAEAHVRYVGVVNVTAENISKTIRAMEMNAKNVFDEVSKHLDSPEAVIGALKSKTNLNPEVKGYFAAFVPEYFKEKGRWFEPYVHHRDSDQFVVNQVGSARHDYTKSGWYQRAEEQNESFWSDPYYYQDNDEIGLSGHYCTFVQPVFDGKGQLVCVCGADMTLEWLVKKLRHIDESCRTNAMLNLFHKGSQEFYTVVLDNDGSPIVHPEGKPIGKMEGKMLSDMMKKLSGMKDMTVNGMSARVYYTPIEDMNWTVALVVPKEDIWQPLFMPVLALFALTIAGIIAIWIMLIKR